MKKSGSAGHQPASNFLIPSGSIRFGENRCEWIRARERVGVRTKLGCVGVLARERRCPAGTALLELVGITFIVIVMALLSVNIGVLIFAAWLNDSAARDSCRAAAQQGNADDAKAAAVIACKQFATAAGGVVGDPKVLLEPANFEFEIYPDEEGRPQLDKGPFVRVTTSLVSRLPAPVIISNVGFTDLLVFKQTYTFPLLEPDTEDTGEENIDPAAAQQEEDSMIAEAASAAADGADLDIPAPTTLAMP